MIKVYSFNTENMKMNIGISLFVCRPYSLYEFLSVNF